jgi:competence protein ComEC
MADNGQSRTRAVVVVSARQAPSDFHRLLIDRKTWRANGALALRWTGGRFELSAARPPGYQRSWAHLPDSAESAAAPLRSTAPDATPKVEDLEPDD